MSDRPLITVEYDGPAELQPVVVAARNPLLRPGDRVTIKLDTQATPPRWLLTVRVAATGWQTTLTSERYASAAIDVQLVHLIADLVMLPLPLQQYPPVKCAACGWVHVAIPLAVAKASSEDIERYLCCFRCGKPTTQFVPAEEGDAPMGCTLQACVLPFPAPDITYQGPAVYRALIVETASQMDAKEMLIDAYKRQGENIFWLVFVHDHEGRRHVVSTVDYNHLPLRFQVPELLKALAAWSPDDPLPRSLEFDE